MALRTGVSGSKVLILVGAGLTSSIVLRSGRLSDLIAQLQDILKGVHEADVLPEKFDNAVIRAQIRVCTNCSETTNWCSGLLLHVVGWSFSDVMYVTRQNVANAVATVSKQLGNVHETLASTKKHLSKKLENLDFKVEEQKEITQLIANDVNEVKSNLSQIGFEVELIHQMVSGLEGKVDLIESKQDATNSGLWYLCQVVDGVKGQLDTKPL